MSVRTRFENEASGNSEMANYLCFFFSLTASSEFLEILNFLDFVTFLNR